MTVSRDGSSLAVAGDAQPVSGLPSVAPNKSRFRARPHKPLSGPVEPVTDSGPSDSPAPAVQGNGACGNGAQASSEPLQHPEVNRSAEEELESLFGNDCVSGFKIAARGPMGASRHGQQQQRQQQQQGSDSDESEEHSDFGDGGPTQRAQQRDEEESHKDRDGAGPSSSGSRPGGRVDVDGEKKAQEGGSRQDVEVEGKGRGKDSGSDGSFEGEEGGSEDDEGQRMGGKHHGGPDEGPMRAPIFVFSLTQSLGV